MPEVCVTKVDPETLRYVDVDAAFCRLVGHSREDLLRMNVYEIALDNEPHRIAEMHGGRLLVTRRLRRADGSTVRVWVDATLQNGLYVGRLAPLDETVSFPKRERERERAWGVPKGRAE